MAALERELLEYVIDEGLFGDQGPQRHRELSRFLRSRVHDREGIAVAVAEVTSRGPRLKKIEQAERAAERTREHVAPGVPVYSGLIVMKVNPSAMPMKIKHKNKLDFAFRTGYVEDEDKVPNPGYQRALYQTVLAVSETQRELARKISKLVAGGANATEILNPQRRWKEYQQKYKELVSKPEYEIRPRTEQIEKEATEYAKLAKAHILAIRGYFVEQEIARRARAAGLSAYTQIRYDTGDVDLLAVGPEAAVLKFTGATKKLPVEEMLGNAFEPKLEEKEPELILPYSGTAA